MQRGHNLCVYSLENNFLTEWICVEESHGSPDDGSEHLVMEVIGCIHCDVDAVEGSDERGNDEAAQKDEKQMEIVRSVNHQQLYKGVILIADKIINLVEYYLIL